jgi:hypothetical protein
MAVSAKPTCVIIAHPTASLHCLLPALPPAPRPAGNDAAVAADSLIKFIRPGVYEYKGKSYDVPIGRVCVPRSASAR